jgi:hypothetical protein
MSLRDKDLAAFQNGIGSSLDISRVNRAAALDTSGKP